jgi:uncharacterized protein YbjQ (UPF0145 family)
MQTKQRTNILLCILASVGLALSYGYGQEEKKILTVPGDISIPYDIIDGVAFVKDVRYDVSLDLISSDIQKSYNSALQEAFGDLEKFARKIGADAVINIQLQFVVLPSPRGNANVLLVFGKLVKFKATK